MQINSCGNRSRIDRPSAAKIGGGGTEIFCPGCGAKSRFYAMTDEYVGYNILHASPYTHGTVHHLNEEWVRGIHHTNTLEGHWSHLKKAIASTHIHVSAKHLWKYVAEFSYRRNMRHSHATMFDHLLVSVSRSRLQGA